MAASFGRLLGRRMPLRGVAAGGLGVGALATLRPERERRSTPLLPLAQLSVSAQAGALWRPPEAGRLSHRLRTGRQPPRQAAHALLHPPRHSRRSESRSSVPTKKVLPTKAAPHRT